MTFYVCVFMGMWLQYTSRAAQLYRSLLEKEAAKAAIAAALQSRSAHVHMSSTPRSLPRSLHAHTLTFLPATMRAHVCAFMATAPCMTPLQPRALCPGSPSTPTCQPASQSVM